MKKNILVFPCGSEIGLDIYSSVKYSTHFHLIGASSVDDHGRFVYEDYIGDIPFSSHPDFIPVLKAIVKKRGVDAIYPAMDSVIALLKANEIELGCTVISSPKETTDICLSKSKTYQCLKDTIRVPEQFLAHEVHQFPVFLKPDIGYGAKGTAIVNDSESLERQLKEENNTIILEYLPGEEYTVDCFTNRKRQLLYAAARKRNRIRGGISVNTSFTKDQAIFFDIAERINEKIHFKGAWFYQVKRDANGELCLLEIASRLGGSSLLSRAVGVNLALMTLFDSFDCDVSVQMNSNYSVILDRALDNRYHCDGLSYSTVYIDYDDCLILNKTSVNSVLIRFLFDCINKGKRIVLLTKHIGDLQFELAHFRLDHLFDEVIHIQQDQQKTDFIHSANAIFIDDSFAEREVVRKNWGIPVFGPEMIDLLSDGLRTS